MRSASCSRSAEARAVSSPFAQPRLRQLRASVSSACSRAKVVAAGPATSSLIAGRRFCRPVISGLLPSGHSITAFAIATPIGMFYPELQPSLLAAALLIAFSRIVLGMHFLSDVVVGSVIGVMLALMSYHVFAML